MKICSINKLGNYRNVSQRNFSKKEIENPQNKEGNATLQGYYLPFKAKVDKAGDLRAILNEIKIEDSVPAIKNASLMTEKIKMSKKDNDASNAMRNILNDEAFTYSWDNYKGFMTDIIINTTAENFEAVRTLAEMSKKVKGENPFHNCSSYIRNLNSINIPLILNLSKTKIGVEKFFEYTEQHLSLIDNKDKADFWTRATEDSLKKDSFIIEDSHLIRDGLLNITKFNKELFITLAKKQKKMFNNCKIYKN